MARWHQLDSTMRILRAANRGFQRQALRAARNWLRIVLTALALYISLPWLAPTLAKAGLAAPANLLYTLYSPFCHQFAFRSLFLYGDRLVYPLGRAGAAGASFEVYAAESAAYLEQYRYWSALYASGDAAPAPSAEELAEYTVIQQLAARHFIGDERLGYKTSLCARDLAIYSAMFLGALLYRRYRWRIRPLPLWLFLLAGLGPIGLDGLSQLLGYPPFEFWQPRETTPAFRIITGGIFGLMSAWLGLPHLERSMYDIALTLAEKLRQAR